VHSTTIAPVLLWPQSAFRAVKRHHTQQAVFMSDGGEAVRRVQTYLRPGSEHWNDWFHISMRIAVLKQQTKSVRDEVGRADARFQHIAPIIHSPARTPGAHLGPPDKGMNEW